MNIDACRGEYLDNGGAVAPEDRLTPAKCNSEDVGVDQLTGDGFIVILRELWRV
jgi:hypothetical protein